MSFKSRDGEADSLSQLLSENIYVAFFSSCPFHLSVVVFVFFAKLMGEKNNLILSKHLSISSLSSHFY